MHDDIVARARDAGVRQVGLQFTDVLGVAKNVAIPVELLPRALDGEVLFDGSSIEGFARVEEADMFLLPDPATFMILPWPSGPAPTARLICDIRRPDGTPYAGCPRSALKRVLALAHQQGFAVQVAPEVEFFLFERDDQGRASTRTEDQAGYFDLAPIDIGEEVRRDMVAALEQMGIPVEASHHEVSPGQHEIDLGFQDALTAADHLTTLKTVVREVARRAGRHATFMPKPVAGINGSGLHLHCYLTQNGANVFYDPDHPEAVSPLGRHFLAGLIHHAGGFSLVTNPLVNSYKRLVPGYEAPIYVAWSTGYRSPMIRLPQGRGPNTRLELRSPDPSCNPYLALGAAIRAGLDGIEQKWEPPPPVGRNLHRMRESERQELGIDRLPASLEEAIAEFRQDAVMQDALGAHLSQGLIEAKRIEWDVYRTAVHPWELDQYLAVY
jgi:glutamine synthetase